MPQIPVYKRQVQDAPMPQVRVQQDASADMFGVGISKAMGDVGKAMQLASDKMDIASVARAETELRTAATKLLYEDVLKRQGEGAKDADKYFDAQYQGIVKSTMDGLKSPRARNLFDTQASNFKNSLYPHVIKHVSEQADIALKDSAVGITSRATLELSQPNAYRNSELVDRTMQDVEKAWSIAYYGRGKDAIAAEVRKQQGIVWSNVLKTLTDLDDTNGVKDFLAIHGKNITATAPGIVSSAQGWVKDKTEQNDILVTAQTLYEKSGKNLSVALGMINTESPIDVAKYFDSDVSKLQSNLSNNVARLAKALNRTVVVNSGWRSNEEQADLRAKYENGTGNLAAKPGESPHNNGGALDTNTFDDVSDEKLAEFGLARTVKGEHWHLEAVGGGRVGGGYDAVKANKIRNQLISLAHQDEALESQRNKIGVDLFNQWLLTEKPKTIAEIEAKARSLGFDGTNLVNVLGHGKQVLGLLKRDDDAVSKEAYYRAKQDIIDGKIRTESDLVARYGDPLQLKDLQTLTSFLEKSMDKESKMPAELKNRDNLLAFTGVIKELNLPKATAKATESRIMEKVVVQIDEARKAGKSVTRSDIEEWTREQGKKVVIGGSFIPFTGTTLRVGDVPAGWTIDDKGVKDPNGKYADKFENGKFYFKVGQQYFEMRP